MRASSAPASIRSDPLRPCAPTRLSASRPRSGRSCRGLLTAVAQPFATIGTPSGSRVMPSSFIRCMAARANPASGVAPSFRASDCRDARPCSVPRASTYPQDGRAFPDQPNKVRLARRNGLGPLGGVFDQDEGSIYLFLEKSPVHWWTTTMFQPQSPPRNGLRTTLNREQTDEWVSTAFDRRSRRACEKISGGTDPN
jgi:hypothetical protein